MLNHFFSSLDKGLMKHLAIILKSTFFALFLSVSNGFAQATDPFKNNPFVENSLNLLSIGDLEGQNLAAKAIVFKGVTDQRVYKKVAELIQQNMANGNFKELSWLAIGLASSGDMQYRPLLEDLLTKSIGRSKKHIKRALQELTDNDYLNSIAVKDAYVGNNKMVEKNEFVRHVLARLNSDNPDFQKKAVQLLRNKGIQEKRVYDRIGELVTQYSTDLDSENDIYLAWLVEGLAYSGNKSYLPIIENMPKNISERVDRHVRGSRKIFDRQEVINPILAREDLYTGQEKWESIRKNLRGQSPLLDLRGLPRRT